MTCSKWLRITQGIACLLCLITNIAEGQETVYIRHDFLFQKTVYYQINGTDTIWLTKPKAKRQQTFIVDIQNINTFYYSGSIVPEKRTTESLTAKNLLAPFTFLTRTYSGAFAGILPVIEKLKTTRGKSESLLQSEATALLESFEDVYQRIKQDDAYFKKLQLHEAYLVLLKKDITKTEQQLKEDAKIYMQTNLPFLLSAWEQKRLPETKNDMQLRLRIDSINLLYRELTALKTEAKEDFNVDGESFHTKFQKTGYYHAQIMNLAQADYKNGNEFVSKLNSIYNSYDTITNADFHYRFNLEGSGETARFKLTVYPTSAEDGKDTVYRYFEINKPTYGIRLRNSMGIAFSSFTNSNRNYFVKLDSTVGYSRGDRFHPMIASFVHFNFGRSKTIKPGFVSGIGIPLTNERNINFLAGGSLIIGKNESFYVSAGVAGAKVNKLDKGLKPGDKVPSRDYALPFKAFYDLGYFISLSVQLAALNNK
ncbi:MAG TPA: hypothetical protein VFV46_12530 [Lacibacter sp.]|nr:hypothetical protein [Lacibacter sp.]